MAALAISPPLGILLSASSFTLVVPLAAACIAILVTIPVAAWRGRLHIPGYVGLAFLAFAIAFILGRIAGVPSVTGILGVFVSILFFLLMATALGCVLALFFYRQPPEA